MVGTVIGIGSEIGVESETESGTGTGNETGTAVRANTKEDCSRELAEWSKLSELFLLIVGVLRVLARWADLLEEGYIYRQE